jgi:cyclophilin family peptidyl-prolyl cis-trans isomerase
MPTDKRQRQREGRDARREAARAAQARAARRRQVISVGVLLVAVVGIGFVISRTGSSTTPSSAPTGKDCPPAAGASTRKTSFTAAPGMCIDTAKLYSASVETDLGSFTIEFDAKKAPKTVNNFVFLSRYQAYNDVPFHRVIPGFVVQGGDVEKGDGTGGPGYKFADELPEAGQYKVGSVAMANSGPNTNGSQFFVITGDQGAALPPQYSLFGTVTSGMDVVMKIEADGSAAGAPSVTHKIVKVTITEKKG